MRLRDRIVFVVSVSAVLAACSGGGGEGSADDAPSATASTPTEAGATADGPVLTPVPTSAPATAAPTVPTTTEPPFPPIRVEDTVARMDDIATYEAAHGLLAPGATERDPDDTFPVADVPCGVSFRATDTDVADRFTREIVGCEFESVADAEAFAAAWAEWYADDETELYGVEVERTEPVTFGAWSGRSTASATVESGVAVRRTSAVRQEGRRVYRVSVDNVAEPSAAVDVDAEVEALTQRQDAHLDEVLLDADQPGAGLDDAAGRLLLQGVFPSWEQFDEIAGAPATATGGSFWVDIPDHPANVVEWASRSVWVDDAPLSILARRYELPGDAARGAASYELDCGDAPVTEVDGAVSALRCTLVEESVAIVQHGDRTYRIVAGSALPGYDAGAAVDALALALEARLAEYGLADGPEPAVGVDPDVAAVAQMPFEVMPDLSTDDIMTSYLLQSTQLRFDPSNGVVTIEGSYERIAAPIIDGGLIDVQYLVGATDPAVAVAYPTTSAPVEVPSDRWAGNDDVDSFEYEGREQQSFNPIWFRRWGDTVVVVRSGIGEPNSNRERLDTVLAPLFDAIAAHVDTITSFDVAAPGSPEYGALDRVAALANDQPSGVSFLWSTPLASGRPVDGSPEGALADWWTEIRDYATLADDDSLVLGAVIGSQRIVQFESDEAAAAYRTSVLRGTPELAEPVGMFGTTGWLPLEDGHGVFAMRSGRWVFVIEDLAFPAPGDGFDDDGNPLPPRSNLDDIADWSDRIVRSGLGA